MRNGYQILDGDCHVMEPLDLWHQYLEPRYRSRIRAPNRAQALNNPYRDWQIDGMPLTYKISQAVTAHGEAAVARAQDTRYVDGFFNADNQRAAVEHLGADAAFLYPTLGLWMWWIEGMDPELAEALARAYNRWLHQFCARHPQSLHGVGAISMHDPATIADQARAVADLGFKAIMVRPNPVAGRTLGSPAYQALWHTCASLGLAVSVHEGSHCGLPTTGQDRFDSRFAIHACSHPLEMMMALLALLEGGVLERHPNLRFGFLESGAGWVPYWLQRLDSEYEQLAYEVQEHVTRPPSDYFRRQCFVAAEPGEALLAEAIDWIGSDRVFVGSDYPHMDHDRRVFDKALALEPALGKKALSQVLAGNAKRFYGLDD